MTRQTIHLYTVCWDEADMLGFFFRHYDPWVDRYVIFDDGSRDGSLDILGAHPKVDLRRFEHADSASFCISLQMLQDEVWKESRAEADWIIVTAIDEHLHVRHRDLAAYLAEQTACGVTVVPALGFDMTHPELPPDEGRLVDIVTRGRPREAFNKLSIFNPQAVKETNFGAERHAANPAGDIRLPSRDALMLWHYKHLGFERYNEREIAQAARLGQADKSRGLGRHYSWPIDERRAFWLEMKHESRDLSVDGFVPDEVCVRPLWWEERSLARVSTAVASPSVRTERAPLVSVLVKSCNHAPFVRRCIESVLEQSFGDFEIVVTDDASTDDKAEIVESISDPRVRLEVLPHNVGISGAMNLTIARARGRYLAILNSDDYALPDRLSRQVDFLDTHPDVALMFGQICAVDDTGASTDPFNDFSTPLRLPDFSRRSWLRQFFFSGNCLCAPTAMIRREAYKWVGLYDARLFNLQDFDMWVRMVMAGFNIHVSTEVLSAFRVRNNMANASAPTMENSLRSWFEYLQILDRFAMLPDATILEVFSDTTGESNGNGQQILGRLAVEIDSPPHQFFGLQMLFQSAETAADRAELRRRMGAHDVFGAGNRDRFASMLHGFEDEYAAIEDWLVGSLHRMRKRPRDVSGTIPDWFDEDAYLRSNPDVAHARRLGVFSSGYAHWLSHGYKEGRPFRTR